jgi:hypothetical protein
MDSPSFFFYNPASFAGNSFAPDAQIAQLVEQRIENPRVGGSNPPLGTTFPAFINLTNRIETSAQIFLCVL